MKKITSTLLIAIMFASVLLLMPPPAAAATPAAAGSSAASAVCSSCPRGTYRVRGHTKRSRKLTNALITGGIGTAIGAGVGGKRGALIGLGSGAGGYLVYRYIKDRRGHCVRRYTRG